MITKTSNYELPDEVLVLMFILFVLFDKLQIKRNVINTITLYPINHQLELSSDSVVLLLNSSEKIKTGSSSVVNNLLKAHKTSLDVW